MSLRHVLLGFLAEPASGYDLRQTFQQSVRHFWSAELAQIYPTLAKMEREGLLTSKQEASEKGPPRKVYARTEAGREALVDWLSQGPIVRHDRLPYLTQLFFLDEAPIEVGIGFFEALRDDFRSHHEELLAVEEHWRSEDPRYPDQLPMEALVKQMSLRLGIQKYAMTVAWCEECLERLAELEAE